MKPLKNNFAIKLTLSILEIVCCNPISLVAGILGCVFTANANASFKSQRFDDFKAQTKKATIALCIGAIGIVLSVVALIAFVTKIDVKNEQLGSIDTYNEFQLNGKQITLPISMEQFQKLGFTLVDASDTNVINEGETQAELFTDKTFKDEFIGTVYFYNAKSTAVPQSEAIVTGIEIMGVGTVKMGKLIQPKLCLLDGITMDSTPEDIISAYGTPDKKEDTAGDNETSVKYVWYYNDDEEVVYDSLSIHYMKGKIIAVSIQCKGD